MRNSIDQARSPLFSAAKHPNSTYFSAMKISISMVEMCKSYDELMLLLSDVTDILHDSKVKAIFPISD